MYLKTAHEEHGKSSNFLKLCLSPAESLIGKSIKCCICMY